MGVPTLVRKRSGDASYASLRKAHTSLLKLILIRTRVSPQTPATI
jgi:hypothetical protein